MPELKTVRIQKKIYKFEVKRKYVNERHYKIRKKEPMEIIRETLQNFFAPRKEEKKKPIRRMPSEEKGPSFNTSLAIVAVFIALLIVGGTWVYLTIEAAKSQSQLQELKAPIVDKPQISESLVSSSLLTAGDVGSDTYVASTLISYETKNIDNYTISIETYKGGLPSQVFVLDSGRVQAETYPDFIRYLRNKLSKKNILISEISIRQLETLPEGAIVLVPSGVVPKELLGVNSTITPDNLADRGIVIVYIGQTFSTMLDGSTPTPTPDYIKQNIPFDFDERSPPISAQNFSLYQPLYKVTSKGKWTATMAYGSVSILKKGDGAFVFVPQTLDGGWRREPRDAAEDISRIIIENPWAVPDGSPLVYLLTGNMSKSGTLYFYSNPFSGAEDRSVKVYFSANSPFEPNLTVEDIKIIRAKRAARGDLYISGGVVAVSSTITNEKVRMLARFNEPTAAQPNMYLTITDITGAEVANFPQGRVSTQASFSIDVPLSLGKGEYTVSLLDDEGKSYAESYLRIVTLDIIPSGTLQNAPSTYIFRLEREGQPIELNSVKVVVDDGKYGSYEFNNVRGSVNVDLSRYVGSDGLPSGDHTFTFIIGELRENVPIRVARPLPPIFTNPVFLAAIIVSSIIAGLGVIFARREEVVYSIDIPDFPPIARTKIPISPDVILAIFGRVNEDYHWRFTPLTLAEVKNGFKDIFYQGKPVYITDYNVEYLLDALIKKGKVLKALGYYGSAVWEQQAGRSMTYLAMLRRLRDICVNNAVPFTQLGESAVADSEITIAGQQMFLHFYEKTAEIDDKALAALFKRALSTIEKGLTIILFKNDIKKRKFASLLDSPSMAQLLVKLEVENNSIMLLTMDEFEKMVGEFKTV